MDCDWVAEKSLMNKTKNFSLRIIRSIKRRLWELHPKSFFYDRLCNEFPDSPIDVIIDKNLKARVWPGDVLGKSLFVRGLIEEDETKFIKRILQPGMVFIDVGANMGYYSLIGAKMVGTTGQVHSFEPSPRMVDELKHNVNLNGFNNIHINNLALGNNKGVAQLSRYEAGKEVYGSISQRPFPGAQVIGYDDVQVIKLDEYVKENGISQVDAIKMDVEGAELLVLKGARDLLKNYRPTIIFELATQHVIGFKYTCDDVLDFLTGLGYDIYTLEYGKLCTVIENPSEYKGLYSFIAK
jgi:FkbM family methyltransferase